METHQKENLADIKFENAKDPEQELRELEEKVAELRQALGKPQMVEAKPVPEAAPDAPEQPAESAPAEPEQQASVEVAFDPFAAISMREGAGDRPRARPAPEAPPEAPPAPQAAPQPFTGLPDATERDVVTAKGRKVKAYVANPSVPSEVVESRAEVVRVAPPVIDPGVQSRNPRFQKQV
jgi:hypothetical protein